MGLYFNQNAQNTDKTDTLTSYWHNINMASNLHVSHVAKKSNNKNNHHKQTDKLHTFLIFHENFTIMLQPLWLLLKHFMNIYTT